MISALSGHCGITILARRFPPNHDDMSQDWDVLNVQVSNLLGPTSSRYTETMNACWRERLTSTILAFFQSAGSTHDLQKQSLCRHPGGLSCLLSLQGWEGFASVRTTRLN